MPPPASEERRAPRGKIANRLVALSSAAVMTVYGTGYLRTRSAAQRLEAAERPRIVIPATAGPAAAPSSINAAASVTPPPAATTGAPKKVSRTSSPTKTAAQPVKPVPVATETQTATAVVPVVEAAAPAVEPPAVPATPPAPVYKDGSYSGWGTSRHGDIQATVVIESGRIASAVISQCWTRYSCSWVAHLQGQVVARQSPEVDWVSGATQSVNAFYYAVVEALSKAK